MTKGSTGFSRKPSIGYHHMLRKSAKKFVVSTFFDHCGNCTENNCNDHYNSMLLYFNYHIMKMWTF